VALLLVVVFFAETDFFAFSFSATFFAAANLVFVVAMIF
jgi:hypothetical protein